MSRLLEVKTSKDHIIFDDDERFSETIDIDGMLFTVQDLVLMKLYHDNTAITTHHVKWSPMTRDEIACQNEEEWLSYKYSIMQTELAGDGSFLTRPNIIKTSKVEDSDISEGTITFDCSGKLKRPSVKLDPTLFTSIHAFSENGGTNTQDEDFLWYIENFSKLYEQYGSCYVAIKNKTVIGVYNSFAEGVFETRKTEEDGTFIIQQCAKSIEELVEYI